MRISISSISKATVAAFVLGVLNLSPVQASILDVTATISSGGLHAFPTDTASVTVTGETKTTTATFASMLQATWNNSSATLTGTPGKSEGWTLQYLNTSNNTWGALPSDRTLVGGVRSTGNLLSGGVDADGRQIISSSYQKTPEVAASNLTLNGGGDGWDVFFDEDYTKIFNVYHHSTPSKIDCHLLAGGGQCSGFQSLPNGLGTNDRSTGVVVGSKIYVPAGYGSNPGGGLACFTTSGSTCSTPFIQLTNLTGTGGYNNILNVARAGNQVFTSNGRDGKLLCYDADSQTACAGMPTNGFDIGLSSVASFPSNILVYNSKVYVSDGSGNVGCFDTVTNDKCANWSTVWHSSTRYSLFLLPNASGSIIGLCLFNNISNGSTVDCVDPVLKTTVTSSLTTSLISALNAVPAYWNGSNLGGYTNTPPTVGSRIYWADVDYEHSTGKLGCWDASLASGAGAPCPNFTGGSGTPITYANYTVRVDPVTPTCIWINNNSAQIRQFDVVSGQAGCASGGAKVRYTATEVVPRVSCLEENRVRTWKFFKIDTVTGGTYDTAKITILNSQGQVIPGWENVTVPANTPLDLSSLTISQTGMTPQFNLTLTGGTAINITGVVAGAVYVASAPELCFQVVAKGGCPDMTSFGTGVAGVTDPALRLESITVEAVDSNTVTGSLSIFRYATGCLATINGQTTDFESSTALANAPVQIKDASGNTSYVTVQTDVSGNYVVNNLKPGAYTVFFGPVTGKTVKSANNVAAAIDSVTAATVNGIYMIYVAPKAADVPPPPQTNSISGMTPIVGPTSGGTVVTITGDFHSPVLNLEVDGVRLSPSQWQQTPTSIIITMPKHPIGPVMIQIYNGQSPLLAPRGFTYVETPGATPSPTATPKASPTPRPSRTPRPVVKPTPTPTPKPTPSASASATTSSTSSSAGATVSPSASPSPTKLVAGTQSCMALGTVYFDTDSWVLKSSTLESLSDVADLIKATGSKKACIVGFTDSRASIEYNLWLSKHRVDAVYAQMKSLLPGLAIERDFKGKANPAAVNDSPEKGMAKNRRVEIGILK